MYKENLTFNQCKKIHLNTLATIFLEYGQKYPCAEPFSNSFDDRERIAAIVSEWITEQNAIRNDTGRDYIPTA